MHHQWRMPACDPFFPNMHSLLQAANRVDPRSTSTPEAAKRPVATPPQGMSICVIPTGTIASRAALAFSGGAFDELRRFALCAVLVRHPRGDLLFDAGIGKRWESHRAALPWLMRKTTQVTAGRSAAEQLAAHGYDVSGLTGIVLTHAHWDHISGVEDFPSVPVWMAKNESQFIASGHRSTAVARSIEPMTVRTFDFDRRPYLGFPCSQDVWSDGSIVLVPAPGHTPGSIIAFITLASGKRFALIGDIVWQLEGIERVVERPWLIRLTVDSGPREVRQLIHNLAALHRAHPDIQLIPAHDERAMATLPVWPQTLV